MESELNHSLFAQNLNGQFCFYADTAAVPMELVEVSELALTPRQEQFSLVFHGPDRPFLPQQLYRGEHDTIGTFDLFLVPIGRDAHGYLYQAVFNRLRDGDR